MIAPFTHTIYQRKPNLFSTIGKLMQLMNEGFWFIEITNWAMRTHILGFLVHFLFLLLQSERGYSIEFVEKSNIAVRLAK